MASSFRGSSKMLSRTLSLRREADVYVGTCIMYPTSWFKRTRHKRMLDSSLFTRTTFKGALPLTKSTEEEGKLRHFQVRREGEETKRINGVWKAQDGF